MKFLGDFEFRILKQIGPDCRGLFWFQSEREQNDLTPLMDYLLDEVSVFEQASLETHHLFFGKSFGRPFFILKLVGEFENYQNFLIKNQQVFDRSLEWGDVEKEFVGILGRSVSEKELKSLRKILPKSNILILN